METTTNKRDKKIKDKKLRAHLHTETTLKKEGDTRLQEEKDYFNTEQAGYLEVDHEEDGDRARTLKVGQDQLKTLLGVQNAQSVFNLNLKDFGPYKSLDFTRNGKFLALGSRKGHLALMDWKKKDLMCEFQTKQVVRDVHFL